MAQHRDFSAFVHWWNFNLPLQQHFLKLWERKNLQIFFITIKWITSRFEKFTMNLSLYLLWESWKSRWDVDMKMILFANWKLHRECQTRSIFGNCGWWEKPQKEKSNFRKHWTWNFQRSQLKVLAVNKTRAMWCDLAGKYFLLNFLKQNFF